MLLTLISMKIKNLQDKYARHFNITFKNMYETSSTKEFMNYS
jgi:hypothetical protein